MVPEARGALATPGLLEGLPDTVVVADREGRIAYVNPAVGVLLGHDPAVLIGQPLQVLMPARFRHFHHEGFSRFRATGQGKLVGATTRVSAMAFIINALMFEMLRLCFSRARRMDSFRSGSSPAGQA